MELAWLKRFDVTMHLQIPAIRTAVAYFQLVFSFHRQRKRKLLVINQSEVPHTSLTSLPRLLKLVRHGQLLRHQVVKHESVKRNNPDENQERREPLNSYDLYSNKLYV